MATSWDAILHNAARALGDAAGVAVSEDDLVASPDPKLGDISFGRHHSHSRRFAPGRSGPGSLHRGLPAARAVAFMIRVCPARGGARRQGGDAHRRV